MSESEIIYELEVGKHISEEGKLHFDIPEAYRVEENAAVPSGLIVYGKYSKYRSKPEWIPNPNCRELIAHLLRRLSGLS